MLRIFLTNLLGEAVACCRLGNAISLFISGALPGLPPPPPNACLIPGGRYAELAPGGRYTPAGLAFSGSASLGAEQHRPIHTEA